MRRPVIETATGKVVNVVEHADGSDWQPPKGHELGPDGGERGDTWDGSKYVKPPPLPQPEPAGPTLEDRVADLEATVTELLAR